MYSARHLSCLGARAETSGHAWHHLDQQCLVNGRCPNKSFLRHYSIRLSNLWSRTNQPRLNISALLETSISEARLGLGLTFMKNRISPSLLLRSLNYSFSTGKGERRDLLPPRHIPALTKSETGLSVNQKQSRLRALPTSEGHQNRNLLLHSS